VELIERLRPAGDARIVDFGTGSGRNTAALTAAGFSVLEVADDRTRGFAAETAADAAIGTHALLHGTTEEVEAMVEAVAASLKPHGVLFATFGSTADARYGAGTRIDANTFAPDSGDEQGVAHCYFDEPRLRRMLERRFVIESMEERGVDDIVGRWAHAERPQRSVHWFVRAIRRQ
jgi:hypothetical protein